MQIRIVAGSSIKVANPQKEIILVATGTPIPFPFTAKADQEEAEAGNDNEKGMTPLRTKESIAANQTVPTAANIGAVITGAAAKPVPVDADILGLSCSAAGGLLKQLSYANLKAALKTYFDSLYATGGGGSEFTEIETITVTTPVALAAFTAKLTDDYNTYDVLIKGLSGFSGSFFLQAQLGIDDEGTPLFRTTGYLNHLSAPHSNSSTYYNNRGTGGLVISQGGAGYEGNGQIVIEKARSASLRTQGLGRCAMGNGSLVYNNRISGEYAAAEKHDHIQIYAGGATFSSVELTLRGANR